MIKPYVGELRNKIYQKWRADNPRSAAEDSADRTACPVIFARGIKKPHLGYGYEQDGTESAYEYSSVRILPAMVFAQYVGYQECAGKQYITKYKYNEKINKALCYISFYTY